MARRKGVAAPKKSVKKHNGTKLDASTYFFGKAKTKSAAEAIRKESWRLENLRLRLKKHDTLPAAAAEFPNILRIELYGVAREALDFIEDLEREAFEMKKSLDDSNKTIESLESDAQDLRDKLSDFDTAVSEAARRVIELVPVVLGREDVVSESIEAFDLRRAVEDLETAC